MQINTAKFSPISEGKYTVFELDSIFMITSSSDSFELFRRHDKQFNSNQQSVLDLLKNVYHQTKSTDSESIIVKIVDAYIYALCAGGAGAFVLRDQKLVPLIKTSKSDSNVVSGVIKPGDSFLFATHDVIAALSMDDISNYLAEPVANASAEKLIQKLESRELCSFLIIKSGKFVSDIVRDPMINPVNTIKVKGGLRGKLIGFIDKTLEKLPSRKIVLQSDEITPGSSRRKSATLVGIVLLLFLAISIYLGLRTDSERRRKAEYEPELSQAEYNLKEAKDLVGLSPTRAQELILSSRQIALSLKETGIEDERLDSLISEIQNNLGPIAGIYEKPAELYLDLSLINSEFKGNDLSINADLIRVLDFDSKRLVGIDIKSKRTNIISGPEYLPDALQTFSYEDRSFILSSDGIREVTDEVELVIRPEWNPQQAIVASFAGNIYVVDKEAGAILRYQGVRGGFLEASSWLGEGIVMDFSQSVSMSIDGEIWVLESNGNIDRLSAGVPQRFSLKGERIDIDQSVSMYTDEESNFLYILDKSKSRIAVFDKEGQYIGEYTTSELSDAIDFVISEAEKKALFLTNGKLYSLELNHLNNETNQ